MDAQVLYTYILDTHIALSDPTLGAKNLISKKDNMAHIKILSSLSDRTL